VPLWSPSELAKECCVAFGFTLTGASLTPGANLQLCEAGVLRGESRDCRTL